MRKLFAPILLTFLLVALISLITVAVFYAITNPQTRVQSLSAIASSVSAMVAAIVAMWVAWREFDTRQRARVEAAEKELTGRQRAAALLGGKILSWADRKDTQDLMNDLSRIASPSAVKDYLDLTAIADRAPEHKKPSTSIYWLDEIIYVGQVSRLAAIERIKEIPNIWSLFAKGDWKGDLHGIDANYFTVMDTTWTNLEMRSQELRSSFLSLQNFSKEEGDLFRILAWALMDEAVEIKNTLDAFMNEARGAGKFLIAYVEGPAALSLHSPSDLQARSSKRSRIVDDAWKVISFSRAGPAILSSVTMLHQMVDGVISEGRSTIAYMEEARRVFEAERYTNQPVNETPLDSLAPSLNEKLMTETIDDSAG